MNLKENFLQSTKYSFHHVFLVREFFSSWWSFSFFWASCLMWISSSKSMLINSSAMLWFCLPPSKLPGFVHSCRSASSGFANAYMQCYMQCTNTFFKEDVKTSFGSFSAVSNYRYIINESDIYLSSHKRPYLQIKAFPTAHVMTQA